MKILGGCAATFSKKNFLGHPNVPSLMSLELPISDSKQSNVETQDCVETETMESRASPFVIAAIQAPQIDSVPVIVGSSEPSLNAVGMITEH